MARFAAAVNVSVVNSITGGVRTGSTGSSVADPMNASGAAAAVTVLQADGASPTQAHVNTLIAALGTRPANTDVVVSFDAATVITLSTLKHALLRILKIVEGTNQLAA